MSEDLWGLLAGLFIVVSIVAGTVQFWRLDPSTYERSSDRIYVWSKRLVMALLCVTLLPLGVAIFIGHLARLLG